MKFKIKPTKTGVKFIVDIDTDGFSPDFIQAVIEGTFTPYAIACFDKAIDNAGAPN